MWTATGITREMDEGQADETATCARRVYQHLASRVSVQLEYHTFTRIREKRQGWMATFMMKIST